MKRAVLGLLVVAAACRPIKECNDGKACPSGACGADGFCMSDAGSVGLDGGVGTSSSSGGSSSTGASSSSASASSVTVTSSSSSTSTATSLAASSSSAAASSSSTGTSSSTPSSSSAGGSGSSAAPSSSTAQNSTSVPQACNASSFGSSGSAATSDALTMDRSGWSVANASGAQSTRFDAAGLTVVPAADTGWFNDGITLSRNNGYYRFVEIPGDFRARVTVTVTSTSMDGGPPDFTNAGMLVRVPSRCLVANQPDTWFLLDHGYQGDVVNFLLPTASEQSARYFGLLWKQNQASPDGGVTLRQPFPESSPTLDMVICRRGTTVEGCFRGTGAWTCGLPLNEPALSAIPALNVGVTAAHFSAEVSTTIAAAFRDFVVDGAPDGGDPCWEAVP